MNTDVFIEPANKKHTTFLLEHDSHIPKKMLIKKISDNEILIIRKSGVLFGWLRYGYFWDIYPIMNMLYLLKKYRGKGYGTLLTEYWERMLLKAGYKTLLTSTQADETAQHFYRKRGYKDIGSFILPYQPLELILIKTVE